MMRALQLFAFACIIAGVLAIATACAPKPRPNIYPAREDVEALVVPRPRIPEQAILDPSADARYRAEVRAWEDEFAAAGKRVCLYLKRAGMVVDCRE